MLGKIGYCNVLTEILNFLVIIFQAANMLKRLILLFITKIF